MAANTNMTNGSFVACCVGAAAVASVFVLSVGCRYDPPNKEPRVRIIATAKHQHLRPLPVASSPSLDELAARTTALDMQPSQPHLAGQVVHIDRCTIAGPPLLDRSVVTALRGVAVHDDHLMLLGPKGNVRAYRLAVSDKKCAAQPDTSFGKNGAWKVPRAMRFISQSAGGTTTVISDGFLGCYFARGKPSFTSCPSHVSGNIALAPSGNWGIRFFSNSDVKLLSLSDASWPAHDWALQHLTDDTRRKGPFINVTAVSVSENRVTVGGILVGTKHERGHERRAGVAVFDKAGHQKLTFSTPNTTPPLFGWIHAITPCGPHTCVLDATRGMLTVWRDNGSLVAQLQWSKALGLQHPWVASMAFEPKSDTLFVTVAAPRKPTGRVAEGAILRLRTHWNKL